MPDVSLLVVGMNHRRYLENFFRSFYQNLPSFGWEIIYVDNCSTDGSADFVRDKYPQVKIKVNTEIIGFAENNNAAARLASGKILAILNPDIEFLPGSLDKLYLYFLEKNFTGILVPRLLNTDRTYQFNVRGYPSPRVLLHRMLTFGKDSASNEVVEKYLFKNIEREKTQFVDWATGAALFLPAETYRSLKGFDENFFLYMEDVDLCLRSWKAGFPVVYFPAAALIHNHLRSSRKLGASMLYHFRSMFLFFKKHGINIKSHRSEAITNFSAP